MDTESWRRVRWAIPLERRPLLAVAAASSHGDERPVERYFMARLWQVHLYRHEGELRVRGANDPAGNGIRFPLHPGTVSILPPETHSEYRLAGQSDYVYAHFGFADGAGGDAAVFVPAVQHLGDEAARYALAFEQVIGAAASARRWRAEVRLWELLCQLAERAEGDDTAAGTLGAARPAVERARRLIELRLGEPLTVAAIAEEVGLSQSQLARLFRAELGISPRQYLLGRRVERARHLLVYTTRPIKAIAREVGVGDLHQFNKMLRRALDAAPREVRRRGG